MTSSSTDLLLLQRGRNVPNAFTLDIEVDETGSISAASVGGDSSLFTIKGTRIVGAAGTEYEGFTFVYAGSRAASVDLSFSTGIAERLYNVADGAANDTLATLIADLKDTNETLKAKSDDITARAETYRTNLTKRYAAYQAAIEAAESVLQYLTTLIDTWNSSS
jgi:flagellar hook-associated protein 2